MASLAALATLPPPSQENGVEQVRLMRAAIGELLDKIDGFKRREEANRKNIVDCNAFKVMTPYSGKENNLKDFETRLQALVRGHVGFERFLDFGGDVPGDHWHHGDDVYAGQAQRRV